MPALTVAVERAPYSAHAHVDYELCAPEHTTTRNDAHDTDEPRMVVVTYTCAVGARGTPHPHRLASHQLAHSGLRDAVEAFLVSVGPHAHPER